MEVPSLELQHKGQRDRHPSLMERPTNNSSQEHVIDMTARSSVASSSGFRSEYTADRDALPHGNRPSSSSQDPSSQSSSSTSIISNSRNASSRRRGDSLGRRNRSPLNSGLWISIELIITVSQITASVVVLSLSRHENPRAPLFAWVVGYAAGCVATLPLLYWRYVHRNHQGAEQESTRARQSSQNSISIELPSYSGSVSRVQEEDGRRSTGMRWWNGLRTGMGLGATSLRYLLNFNLYLITYDIEIINYHNISYDGAFTFLVISYFSSCTFSVHGRPVIRCCFLIKCLKKTEK